MAGTSPPISRGDQTSLITTRWPTKAAARCRLDKGNVVFGIEDAINLRAACLEQGRHARLGNPLQGLRKLPGYDLFDGLGL